MNALFLKDLADKTRRGLRGRVEAGKSGGGKAYGYDVVKKFDASGDPIRGERHINREQARIITEIFNLYATGVSPKAIAKQLNERNIPSPSGKGWGQSTINGNRERGTGILNNELYIGRMVWNRLTYMKDPDSGKRVSRPNPEADWIIRDVPDLAIVEPDLWLAVKDRQQSLELRRTKSNAKQPGMWDRRRPKYLFSGLMKCGVCGGGYSKVSKDHFGCSTARNKGTCNNRRTIRRDLLEDTVLNGLQHHLMDPELAALFAEEYTRELNTHRIERNTTRDAHKAEFERVDAELDKLVDAICDGIPAIKVKDRMWELEHRKEELARSIAATEDAPVYVHPNMGKRYREQVSELVAALNNDDNRAETTEILRGLIDKIVLTPVANALKGVSIDLHGALAGILTLAQESQSTGSKRKKASILSNEDLLQVKLVAGVGFEPTTFRL